MMAAGIVIYSIKYIQKRQLFKFAICLLIACFFHLSMIVFLPVYFLYNVKLSNIKIAGIVIITFVLSEPISSFLKKIISLTKYNWYLNSQYKAERIGIIIILINVSILIFAMLLNTDKKNDIYIKIQCLAVMISAFIGKIPVANRMVWTFGLPSIILIPNIIYCQKSKSTKVFLFILIGVVYLIYFIYTVGMKNSNSVLPYRTIFSR